MKLFPLYTVKRMAGAGLLLLAITSVAAQSTATGSKTAGAKPTPVKKATPPPATDDDLLVEIAPKFSDDDLLVEIQPQLPDEDLLVPIFKETKPTISLTDAQLRQLIKTYWQPVENYLDQRKKQFQTIDKYVVKKRKVFFAECDFIGLFERIPMPVSSLGASLSAYCNNPGPYETYNNNLQTAGKRFGETIQANSSFVELSNKGQAAIEKEALRQTQQNPMLNGIDVEKLAKMSESERAKYAEQVKKQMMANAAQVQQQGLNNDPEMMAIMMNAKLSAAQKEAAVKALMNSRVEENKSKPITPKTEKELIAENAGFEKTMKEVNEGRFQQRASLLMSATMQSFGRAETRYTKAIDAINAAQDRFSQKMSAWYQAAYDKLPITVVGENADKDPTELEATAKKIHQQFAEGMLSMKAKAIEQYQTEAKYAVGRFHDFMADFKPGQHQPSNPFNDIVIQVGQGGELVLQQAYKIAAEAAAIAGYGCGQAKHYLLPENNDCSCLSKKN